MLSSSTTEDPVTPSPARRAPFPGPVSAARTPASDAAPLGPDRTPSPARSAPACVASWSVTAMAASSPPASTGHARLDGVPQLSPAITVPPVVTDCRASACKLASTPAAVSGSTARMAGADLPPGFPGPPGPREPPEPAEASLLRR